MANGRDEIDDVIQLEAARALDRLARNDYPQPYAPVYPNFPNSLPVVTSDAKVMATLGEDPEQKVIELEFAIVELAKRAREQTNDPALQDLWHLAAQQLEPLRVAIARARQHEVKRAADPDVVAT